MMIKATDTPITIPVGNMDTDGPPIINNKILKLKITLNVKFFGICAKA